MLFLGFFISLFLGTVYSQIRYHEPHPEHKFNYSYINVRHVKGHKLTGEAPLSAFSTRNRTDCHRDCVKSIKSCKSINVAETTEGFECQTMGIDIYSKGVLVPDIASSHYIIAVSINYFRCYIDIFRRFFLCFPSFLLPLLLFASLLFFFPSSFYFHYFLLPFTLLSFTSLYSLLSSTSPLFLLSSTSPLSLLSFTSLLSLLPLISFIHSSLS